MHGFLCFLANSGLFSRRLSVIRWNRGLALGLALCTLGLVSCLFDDTKDASAWLNKTAAAQKFSIKADTLIFDNLKPVSVSSGSLPIIVTAMTRGGIGQAQGSRQDLFLSILETDSNALQWLGSDGAGKVGIRFALDSAFYTSMPQKDSLPFYETGVVRVWWKFRANLTKAAKDSVVADTSILWVDSLTRTDSLMRVAKDSTGWDSASVPISLSLDSVDKRFTVQLPEALRNLMAASKGMFRLQLHLMFDRTERVYRVQGPRSSNLGKVKLSFSRNDSLYKGNLDSLVPLIWMAQVGYNTEKGVNALQDTTAHLVLHSGVNDSLLIELPADAIWAALKLKLGDSLAVRAGQLDSVYSNRLVLMAMIELPSDPNPVHAETGYPIPVAAVSILDSVSHAGIASTAGGRYIESRRLDTADVLANGHPNLLFYPSRDSLHLQITAGIRHWLTANRYYGDSIYDSKKNIYISGSKKVGIRTVLKLSTPMQSPKDVASSNYTTIVNSDTVTTQIYSTYASYSRWDLGLPADQRYRLRIWLTEKR